MQQHIKEQLRALVEDFRLPRYDEIPDVGLYLEQVTKYINEYCGKLMGISITGSMVSNYVKKDLLDNPVKKQYSRDQVAYLIFIAVAKSVLSLENIRLFVEIQKKTYDSCTAYNYFCRELENVIHYIFGIKEELDAVGIEKSDEKIMLRNTIIAASHKIYLEQFFAAMKKERENESN